MFKRFAAVAVLFLAASAASAKDVYLAVAGSVGIFRTDMRIINPSTTRDITVQAYYLPATGIPGQNNASVQPKSITLPKRQQQLYNDVTVSLFNSNVALGAIRLTSDDDFIVSERIYATTTSGCGSLSSCTTGQGIAPVDATAAKKNGILLQLSRSANFRTNVFLVNPNNATATAVFRVYDKNNALAGSARSIQIPPYGVISPVSMQSYGDSVPDSADLSDAWLSYTSDQPLVVWAAVNDNGSTDSTSILAIEDPNPTLVTTPTVKTFNIEAFSFGYSVTPPMTGLKVGDVVTVRLTASAPLHSFRLIDGSGEMLVPDVFLNEGDPAVSRTFTVKRTGQHVYMCTNASCGTGHSGMLGTFNTTQ